MIFRVGYGAAWLVLLSVRLRWMRRAEVLAPGVVDVPEGWPIRAIRWLLLLPVVIGVVLWPLEPGRLGWQEVALSTWLRAAGLGVEVAGLALLVWVHEALRENFSPFLRIRADHRLIESGPYRRVRHPMYTAFALILIGFALITQSGLLLVATGLMMAALRHRTRQEEAMLIGRFGEAYRDYMGRTGALLPLLR